MKKMEKVFNSTVAVVATFFTYLFGGVGCSNWYFNCIYGLRLHYRCSCGYY